MSSTDGVQCIDFDRDAGSFDAAVSSAMADVEGVDGVRVVRLEGDGPASTADIAVRSEV